MALEQDRGDDHCDRDRGQVVAYRMVEIDRGGSAYREYARPHQANTDRRHPALHCVAPWRTLEVVPDLADRKHYSARGQMPPLKAIVCNAGVQIISGLTFNTDGFETTFAVNHLGHFLLVNLLLGQLVPVARIVVVSSGTYNPDQFTGMPKPIYSSARSAAKPQPEADGATAGRRAYTTSKLCNVMFAYELSRRLRAKGREAITVNAFDPGLMPGTGLARDYSRAQKFIWNYALPALRFIPGVNSTRRSGRDLARLVLDPALEAATGRYFVGRRELPSSKQSYDESQAAELWEASAEMVGLRSDETILESLRNVTGQLLPIRLPKK